MDTGICDSSAPPSVTIVVRSRDKSNPTKTKEPEGPLNIKNNRDLTHYCPEIFLDLQLTS
jgi:hypothetical protein